MANPNGNPQNLDLNLTTEEAQKRGKAGGIASGKARRRKRNMKTAAKLLLDMGVTSPKLEKQLKALGISDEDLTNQMAILAAMVNQAMKGSVQAAQFLRDTTGEGPTERMHKQDVKLKEHQTKTIESNISPFLSNLENILKDEDTNGDD